MKLRTNSNPIIPKQSSKNNINMYDTKDLLIYNSKNKSLNQMFKRSLSGESVGTLPSNSISYVRHKKSLPDLKFVKPKVLIKEDALAWNMKQVEGSKMPLKYPIRESEKILKRPYNISKKSRRTLIKPPKSKMPQPPIGRTVGHGLFIDKTQT